MAKNFLKKYSFLLLALILLSIAGVNYILFEESTSLSAEEHYGKAVQEKVLNSLSVSDTELTELTGIYQKNNNSTFSGLKLETIYPYYIYKNGKLIYWSDHRYIPEYSWVKGLYDDGLLAKDKHINLIKKQIFYHDKNKLEIISLIPLYHQYQNENDYLQTGFEKSLFPTSPLTIKNTASNRPFLNIHDANQKFLFSIVPPRSGKLNSPEISSSTVALISLALLLLGAFLFTLTFYLSNNKQVEVSIVLILLYFLLVRWFMLTNSLPFSLTDSKLFNPKYFGINQFTPSLGDLLLNYLALTAIVSFIAYFFYKSSSYFALMKASKSVQSVVSVFMILLSTACTYFCSKSLSVISDESSYFLDYSLTTSYDSLKITSLVIFVLLAIIYFLSHHVIISVFKRLNIGIKKGLFHWIYGVLLSFFILIYFDNFWWIYLISAAYFAIVYYYRLPRFLYSFKYQTSVYFFLGAFVFTFISMFVLREQSVKKNAFEKQNYGMRYLAENDALGEGLLSKVILEVKSDTSVAKAITRDHLANQAVKSIVKDKHLDIYFDKYNSNVYSFNSDGVFKGLEKEGNSLKSFEDKYKLNRFKTDNSNIFFINETGDQFIKQYIVFIPLNNKSGTVILDLKLRDEYAESVYPELLMEKRFVQNPESKSYSYAVYNKDNQLVYSNGKFNYLKSLDSNLLNDPFLFAKGIHLDNYDHVGVQGANARKIVVSSKHNVLRFLLSNFSFLFLLLVLVISFAIFLYGLRIGLKKLKLNFSTKIQIYLNAAFLIPFLLVLIVIIGVIRSTLLNIQGNFYNENTKNLGSTIRLHLQDLDEGKMSMAFFKQEVDKLAQDTKLDVNFFILEGDLEHSTRPLIYEYNLLSRKINPEAYKEIIEDLGSEVLLDESLGKLKYKAVYLSLKNAQNKRLGVIGVPFFDSSIALENQLKEVITTILSICIALFLALLILSYFAANQLTNPLKMVAQKIKRTSLNKENIPIKWEADDEIGVLTKSYNAMLQKLEESKDALSQSEKQTAWREMAKQVAHEIKNPLTPMKLSIQQLQRTLPALEEKSQERIKRALNSLTEQIDNISEIANSFSEFAKMPVPRSEVFDLVSTVQKTAYLYAQNNKVDVSMAADENKIFVRSDHQLINRVVTNLIINGLQSVPTDRKPKIDVKVYRNDEEKFAIIEVKDNGSGIPEDVRNKVFLPNFSTKVDGSGLGLAMAKRGIEHSGGNIWFDTEESIGTTFFVDFPLVPNPEY